jgi:hypothetical protein
MAEKNYWKMTADELQAVCKETGVEFDMKNRKETINKVRAAKGELVGPDEPKGEFDKKDFVVVQFHNKDEQDLPFVFISVNGKSWYVPKEKEVLIPRMLLNVINDAVEVKFVQKKAPDGRPYYEERKVHRFPYTLVTR